MKKMILISCLVANLSAEEGMWPFNMLPTEHIAKKYGAVLDTSWAEHVQRSCVRISSGGSGSFVSKNGLVLTNHHVGSTAIYNLSTAENDLMSKGFYAATEQEELKCPNMYVDELISIEDVTQKVKECLTPEMTTAQMGEARKSRIAQIEKEAAEKTHLQPEVVTLYQGGKYNLYLYKRYTDVRLVMAPEKAIAFFGGDSDNFEYPRYDLDMCFFRVYESGKPLAVDHYLRWSPAGPQIGEVLFVAGHPGSTDRMFTSSHLEFLRDTTVPLLLKWLQQRKTGLESFANQSQENKRIAQETIFKVDNSFKVWNGIDQGLKSPAIIDKKIADEKTLYGNPEKFPPWVKLKTALQEAKSFYPTYLVLENSGLKLCTLFMWANHLIRLADEKSKPSEQRLTEYTDTELPALELNLFSTAPIYLSLEKVNLITGLKRLVETLGPHHLAVQIALNGKTAEERADDLLKTTHLQDILFRKKLYEHPQEVKTSTDPLIQLARELDPISRAARQQEESSFDSVVTESYTAIANLIFEKYGETIYPDATFTLRLSMGELKGYEENSQFVKPLTTLGGAYALAKDHNHQDPYNLPPSWTLHQNRLVQTTPFNFVSTNDIIGGNSGSPVINAKGELVGLIFDGNIYSLTWYYEFDETQGRAISVHSKGILEVLQKIYNATALVNEISLHSN